ncbi:alpha/beta hydrolase [Streptomyces sp. RKAG337]|uniref:alpha/beta hydrolase n=2 Tax=unclassified Streptomyces TaxID=2593676 RepID=UPI002034A697|nr:alpha/beta hydrolase-fold protein [Streptomyces sp. RKAG337]MCM2426903.1 esterase family protein [Streptomyces sp. RKAG337]
MKRWPMAAVAVLVLLLFVGYGSRPVVFSGRGGPEFPHGSAGTAASVLTGSHAPFTEQRTTLAGGTKIGMTTYRGKKSGFTGKVWVWAPPQYYDPKYAKSAFPVLIALPGSYGYPYNYWIRGDLGLQEDVARWTAQGSSLPFIIVMPVMNPGPHYHDCSDIPGQQKMGTWMTSDVPDLVRANFRTFKDRDGWAFMGSSSGGFCALKSVLQHPETFKAAIVSGPDIVPDSSLWRDHLKEKQANNPQALAQRLIDRHGPEVYLAFQVGTKESRGELAKVKQFIAGYGHGPVRTRLQVIVGGGHDGLSYLRGMGQGSMKWISDHLRAPTPAA